MEIWTSHQLKLHILRCGYQVKTLQSNPFLSIIALLIIAGLHEHHLKTFDIESWLNLTGSLYLLTINVDKKMLWVFTERTQDGQGEFSYQSSPRHRIKLTNLLIYIIHERQHSERLSPQNSTHRSMMSLTLVSSCVGHLKLHCKSCGGYDEFSALFKDPKLKVTNEGVADFSESWKICRDKGFARNTGRNIALQ